MCAYVADEVCEQEIKRTRRTADITEEEKQQERERGGEGRVNMKAEDSWKSDGERDDCESQQQVRTL